MNTIEKRARELLAQQVGPLEVGGVVNASGDLFLAEVGVVQAIIAALTPPEGYVLVPVELPVEMEIAFMEAWVSKRRCIDDPEMQDAWEAALAARPDHIAHDLKMVAGRPEVKP